MHMLTKLEELILLSVWRLGENAYGKTIYQLICRATGKRLSLGGVYFPLDRLAKKGFLETHTGEATPERSGLSKRYYQITEMGITALKEIKQVNEEMWAGFPGFENYPVREEK